jgi:cytochrome c-type biogenesis protein CcmF
MGTFGTTLGSVFMALGLIASVVAVVALIWGHRLGEKAGEGVTNTGYIATFAVLGSLTASIFILLVAFFQKNFSFQYVAENHSTDVSGLSWLYKISGVWAGREGSLLFWAWLLAIFVGYVAYKRLSVTDRLSNMGVMVANVVQILFLVSLFFQSNNPFKASPAEWIGPNGELLVGQLGMNPLLQHWAMILHPPTLFIGYAGMTIPFAFAVAAIIVNDGSKLWVQIVDRITVFSWLFLGIGIGLGAIWAYVVLGWGGYWAWDPVENASLLPWLTGVGLIHSFTVYRRREGFKRWAVSLAAVSFALVILGTFITRSGVVQSVHAFQQDWLSFGVFLSMIVASLVVGVGGVWWRGKTFAGNDEFDSLTSKESSYYFNNVIMLVAALLVSYLTVTSALPSWMPGGGQSFPASTYDSVARPVGILYVLIMAICPLLAWRKTSGALFWKRVKWPLLSTFIISALLIFEWYKNLLPIFRRSDAALSSFTTAVTNGEAIVGLTVAAFAVSVAVSLFVEGARVRAAAKGGGFFASLGHILTKSRTQSGGYLTHLGVGIVLIGLVGSAMFVGTYNFQVSDTPGATFEVPGYKFVYVGLEDKQLPNGDVASTLSFDIVKNGRKIGVLAPGQIQFKQQQQTKLVADVLVEPLRDVFVTFNGDDPATGKHQVTVKVNPLVSFAWYGFAIMIIGTAVAAWPKKSNAALAKA